MTAVAPQQDRGIRTEDPRSAVRQRVLLTCGLLSSLLYAGMLVVVPTFWVGVWERMNIGAWLL